MEKTGAGKHHKSSVCKTLLDKLAKSQLKRLYRTAACLKAWKRHESRAPKVKDSIGGSDLNLQITWEED